MRCREVASYLEARKARSRLNVQDSLPARPCNLWSRLDESDTPNSGLPTGACGTRPQGWGTYSTVMPTFSEGGRGGGPRGSMQGHCWLCKINGVLTSCAGTMTVLAGSLLPRPHCSSFQIYISILSRSDLNHPMPFLLLSAWVSFSWCSSTCPTDIHYQFRWFNKM